VDKHFTITIHDENGVKKFNVHKLLKKFFFYLLALLIAIGLLAVGTILYLNYSVDKIDTKRQALQKAYETLREKDEQLQISMQQTQERLKQKKQEFDAVSDSLAEIEELMGLKPIENANLQERVNITKLTSQERATLLELIPNGSPIAYHGITSKFGYRTHPLTHKRELHKGTDLKAKRNTPVYATADGIVEWAAYHKRSGFGNLIILVHLYGFKTYFAHLKKIVVKSGQFVKKGDLIGYTGNSGLSNGPHLHYEIRFIQRPLNPYWFIKWTQQNYSQIFEKEKKVPWQSVFEAMSHIQVKK
jgi:murein DD-endopeptidase MepM/ murein hydrolase activator NlpD